METFENDEFTNYGDTEELEEDFDDDSKEEEEISDIDD